MAYERHDPTQTHPGYHSNDVEHPFFEEEESKYASGKYDSKDDPFSGYNTREEEEKEKDLTEFERQVEEENKPKYKDNEHEEDVIQKQAAKELENQQKETKGSSKQKKKNKTIEDAIEKVVKEQKEVITLDR